MTKQLIRWRILAPGLALLAGVAFSGTIALAGAAHGPTAGHAVAGPLTTYMSTDVPKPIPDSGTVTSTLLIPAVGTVSTLDVVGLTISHTLPADLRLVLISPIGTRVTLFSNQCGGDDWNSGNTGFSLSDGALAPLGEICPPGADSYKPEGALSAFAGQAITGLWTLEVNDVAAEDSGELQAWGLAIPGAPAQPTPTRTVEPTYPPAPAPTPCPISFTDVPAGAYFTQGVTYLYCKGAISGYGDRTFRPYNQTTRGQLAKIVTLGLDIPIGPAPATPSFSDVPRSDPFFRYIEAAKLVGIVSGYADGTFHPNAEVTRGQLAKMIVHAAGWDLIRPATATFNDVPPSNTFYSEIETATCYGLVSGYADGSFRWWSNATRGQIAKIAYLANVTTGACAAVPTPLPQPAP
jgi:subtilisin-like proprotein convertase family protein